VQVETASWASVVVRSGPCRTAVNGALVARPSRITPATRLRRWLHLDRWVRPVLGDHRLVGRARRARSSGWGDSNSTSLLSTTRGQKAIGLDACGFHARSLAARVRCCPWFAVRMRTHHGPRGPIASRSRTLRARSSSTARSRRAVDQLVFWTELRNVLGTVHRHPVTEDYR
jgi:hypothetical protein